MVRRPCPARADAQRPRWNREHPIPGPKVAAVFIVYAKHPTAQEGCRACDAQRAGGKYGLALQSPVADLTHVLELVPGGPRRTATPFDWIVDGDRLDQSGNGLIEPCQVHAKRASDAQVEPSLDA